MNRLTDLNSYSNEIIFYEDGRDTNVIFNIANPVNQTITIKENNPHYLPLGITINEIINFAEASTTLTLDFSTVTGTVSFNNAEIPAGIVVTNPSTNVYEFRTFINDIQWREFVENVDILMPFRTTGTFLYTATISYNIGTTTFTKTWTVTITIVESEYITNPVDYTYIPNRTLALTAPQIVAEEGLFNPTWTLNIVPNIPAVIDNVTSSGTGGTTSFNNGTFTIVGNKTEVNSHLATLSVDYSFQADTFYWSYILTNNILPGAETVLQFGSTDESAAVFTNNFNLLSFGSEAWMSPATFNSATSLEADTFNSLVKEFEIDLVVVATLDTQPVYINFDMLSDPGITTYYTNKTVPIQNVANINVDYSNTEEDIVWNVTITDGGLNVADITSIGSGGTTQKFTPTSNNGFTLYTITGSKAQVDSHLNSLTIISKTTTQVDFTLNFVADFGTNVEYQVSHLIQYIPDFWYVNSYPDGVIGGLWVNRTYNSNTANLIFGDEQGLPGNNVAFQPNDIDYTNLTVTLTAENGEFYNPATEELAQTLTISGTYNTFTSVMETIEYWPNYTFTSQETITFTSTKDGEAGQFGTILVDFASAGAIQTENYTFNTPGNMSWTPNALQLKYGRLDYTVIGAGGGGSYKIASYATGWLDLIANGGVTVNTSQFKLGNASIYFDGVDDYVYTNSANSKGTVGALDFGNNGSFDAWIRLDNTTGTKYILDLVSQQDANDHVKIWIVGNQLNVEMKGNQTLNLSYTGLSTDTWTHIAFQADQGAYDTHRLYVNGATVDSATGVDCQVFRSNGYHIYIGCDRNTSNFYQGYIDEIRFSLIPYVGSTSFTPATTEYTYLDGVVIHGNNLLDCPKLLHHDNYQNLDFGAGHGGGGGEVEFYGNQVLENKTYTGTIGSKGVNGFNRFNINGTAGGSTTFNGITVAGGGGATGPIDLDDQFNNPTFATLVGYSYYGRGGTSGSGFLGAGHSGVTDTAPVGTSSRLNGGGGGGGAASAGYVATNNNVSGRGGDPFSLAGGGGAGGANQGYTLSTSFSQEGTGGAGFGANAGYQPQNGAVRIRVYAK